MGDPAIQILKVMNQVIGRLQPLLLQQVATILRLELVEVLGLPRPTVRPAICSAQRINPADGSYMRAIRRKAKDRPVILSLSTVSDAFERCHGWIISYIVMLLPLVATIYL